MAAKCVGLMFSKDRAMQLDAALRSFFLHCTNDADLTLKVIYNVTHERHGAHYAQLASDYPQVAFIRETAFKQQVLTAAAGYEYILFLVDDNIFVRNFSVAAIIAALTAHQDAQGFSLRLGTNTSFCYPLQRLQNCPEFIQLGNGVMKFSWPGADGDFGYPLEVSSSVYRTADIYPILAQSQYYNPNTLEMALAGQGVWFAADKSRLLCLQYSAAFCNPINRVQDTCRNIAGLTFGYTAEQLAKLFDEGLRIDVAKYSGFIPNACHQETELVLIQGDKGENCL